MSRLRSLLAGLAALVVSLGLMWQRWVAPGAVLVPPSPGGGWGVWPAPHPSSSHVLIAAAFYATGPGGPADQFLRLTNPTHGSVSLSGWTLVTGSSRLVFGEAAHLAPGQTLDLANDPVAFAREMGWQPAWAMETGATAGKLELSAQGGQVSLYDAQGQLVDSVCYGEAACSVGWVGAPAQTPLGSILARAQVETQRWQTPALEPDTDTARDWHQGTDWISHRIWRPGQTFLPEGPLTAQEVVAFTSPDSSHQVILTTIDSARRTLDLNVYLLTEPAIGQHLVQAVERGVRVRALLSGNPVGGISDSERAVVAALVRAGADVRFIRELPEERGRYGFDHAKYMVVDGNVLVLGSENWVSTGTPADPSQGNRGWWLELRSPDLARYFTTVFELDFRPLTDVVSFDPAAPGTPFGPPPAGYQPAPPPRPGKYPHTFVPVVQRGPITVTPVLAPDHSLWRYGGILGLLDSSRVSIEVEQASISPRWGVPGAIERTTPNLFLAALIEAARRGVRVRVLLNSAFVKPSDPMDNSRTVALLSRIAEAEHLPLEARLIDLERTGLGAIHNKGVIVDGQRVLVSSINWTENSPAQNREAGLIVESPQIAQYFQRVFAYDWEPPIS